MRIAQVLDRKGRHVVTIGPDVSVAEALRVLEAADIGAVLVSVDGVHPEGILSERDVARGMHRLGCEVRDLRVSVLMTPVSHTTNQDEMVDDVLAQMTEARVRHVPVLEAGGLIGVVSIGDLVKARIDELEAARAELVEYISAR